MYRQNTMSFEELIKKTEKEKYFLRMNQVLYRMIVSSIDHTYLIQFVEPFLPHVNSPSFDVFHTTLKNIAYAYSALPGIIHNMVLESKTNEKLYKVLDLMVRIYHL